MFLAKCIDKYTKLGRFGARRMGFRLIVYRVELDVSGRPVFVLHSNKGYAYGYEDARKRVLAQGDKHWPTAVWMASAAHKKRVSMSEAAKLVDVVPPASLDRLTELLHDM